MPLSFEDALKKDDFYQLPVDEQRKVLGSLNTDFAGLPEKEQNKVIGKYHLNYLNSSGFKQAHPASASGQAGPGYWSELGSTLGSDLMQLGPTISQAAHHPLDTAKALVEKQGQEADIAARRFKKGRYSEAFGHGLAYALPVLGPMAADIGEELPEHPGRAAAHEIELLAPEGAKMLPEKAVLRGGKPLFENVNNPEVNRALQNVKPRVRMTAGQETGNPALLTTEHTMKNAPGASGRAATFYHAQEEDVANEARRLARQPGPTGANPYEAGRAVQDRFTDRIVKLKNQANNLYDQVRAAAAKNQQTVQSGTRPTGLVGPSGQPILAPVTQVFDSPVALDPIRNALRPVYDDLLTNMDEVRRAHSPAFRALDQLMKGDASHMSAMDFDEFLGAVKALARRTKNPYLTSRSQALALKVIGEGEKSLDTALRGAGPNVTSKLRSARNIVKSYYETGELRAQFAGEPATVYKRLSARGDTMADTLKRIQQIAPDETKTIARTYLEGLVEKATGEGGFGRAAGVKEDWRNLGPETKKILFGPQLTKDLDDFFLAAKTLTKPINPSGSGHMVATLGGLGVLGRAVWKVFQGDYLGAAELGAIGYGMPNIMSRVLFSPGGAKLLTQAIKLPVRTPAARATQAALRVRILQAAAQWKKEQQAKQNQPPQSGNAPQ
jgi:hypothetical protein